MAGQPPPNMDDYTPATTIITFDRPIPLLRGPLKASPSDNPEAGPYVLAFKDPKSWATAYRACKAQITQQCEAGARIGCSLAASNKCKPPWWKTLTGGGAGKQDYAERAKCEEREMEDCTAAAKLRCGEFAKMKSSAAFVDAKVAVKGFDSAANRREAAKLLSWVCFGDKGRMLESERCSWDEFRGRFGISCIRGSDLVKFGNVSDVDDYVNNNFNLQN